MTIVDIANLGIGFVVGALCAFGLSWYWVRKYGADLENKVKTEAEKIKEEIKKQLEELKETE